MPIMTAPFKIHSVPEGTIATPPKPRNVWPWKKMQPDQYVTIPAELALQAQKAVHVYGKANNRRFMTRLNKQTGELTVTCLHKVYTRERDDVIDPYPIKTAPTDSELLRARYKRNMEYLKAVAKQDPAQPYTDPKLESDAALPGLDTDQFPW